MSLYGNWQLQYFFLANMFTVYTALLSFFAVSNSWAACRPFVTRMLVGDDISRWRSAVITWQCWWLTVTVRRVMPVGKCPFSQQWLTQRTCRIGPTDCIWCWGRKGMASCSGWRRLEQDALVRGKHTLWHELIYMQLFVQLQKWIAVYIFMFGLYSPHGERGG